MPLVQVNGTELYCESSGSGEPVLLIPGLGLDHTYYAQALPSFAPHMRTFAVDPRGVGRSRKDRCDYSVELWADDFAALVDSLGLKDVHVLGTSLGGAIALSMAARHPAKVKSVMAIGAFSELNESVHLNYSLRKRLIAKIGLCEELADFISLWIMSPQFIETEQGARIAINLRQSIQKNDPELYVSFLDAILKLGKRTPGVEPPLTRQLSEIRVPTLVACSDNDHFIPAALSKVIASRIPHAQYAEIPRGGHIPFIEQPDAAARVVIEFLNSLASKGQVASMPSQTN